MASSNKPPGSYDHGHKDDQATQRPEADITQLEGSLRGLLMGSSPDTHTPPQRHAEIAGPPLPPGFSAKSPHKRLNQKERRLLATQLTVPITERTSVSTITTQSNTPAQPPLGRLPNQLNSSWHQPGPRISQHQSLPQRQPPNDPFHSPQPQGQYSRHAMPPPVSQHTPANNSHQGPQPQQQWIRPHAGMPQNVRPSNQFQQPRQWQAAQPLQTPQAPAFQDVQFQHQRRPPPPTRQLYQPGAGHQNVAQAVKPDMLIAQCEFLESLLHAIIPDVGVEDSEIAEKESFRQEVEHICRDAITKYEQEIGNTNFLPESVALRCFGSTASGFATKASDMDLALLTPLSHISADSADSPIPRVMEKALLDHGYGARLLTRTRVPIIKLCQRPPPILRAELLKERLKWENGAHEVLEDEETIADDDLEEGIESPPEVVELPATDVPITLNAAERAKAMMSDYRQTLYSLVQKTGNKTLSIGDYYGKAKIVLHTLGGRDAGLNGSQALKPKEVEILEDVCEQFVKGLSDFSLREKLLKTAVIQAIINRDCDGHTVRSLSSIHNVVDGETWLAAWASRPLPERTPQLEQSCEAHINAWNRLVLNSPNLNDYSANYNKLVFQFLSKIRSMSSLQLVFLKQGPTESAAQYYARADHIRRDLNVADGHLGDNVPTSIVVSHYISGINSANLRSALEALRAKANLTLRQVGTYHQVLELIRDYEKALDKNSNYADNDRADIEAYVALLRSSIRTPSGDKLIVPISAEFQPLLRKVASLPSPRDVARQNDRFQSHLEFPKSGVGIQCDINFAASLALHNTQLLRCYCAADPRVKPMVLFIKHWAKRRGINTPYRGTLSSYGYVLMVLHYLMNVADPFVVPNLQLLGGQLPPHLSPAERDSLTVCEGRNVRFWRNEQELHHLARAGRLTHNQEKVGSLLRGFFEYYASNGMMTHVPFRKCFDWGRDVLSLRTMGGLITKHEKGWVGAKTVRVVIEEGTPSADPNPPPPAEKGKTPAKDAKKPKRAGGAAAHAAHVPEIKEIRHRYLFAIEDPFELEHNVARTVTHTGICLLRDELRRAWVIVRRQGGYRPGGALDMGLFTEVREKESEERRDGLVDLMREIHGAEVVDRALA